MGVLYYSTHSFSKPPPLLFPRSQPEQLPDAYPLGMERRQIQHASKDKADHRRMERGEPPVLEDGKQEIDHQPRQKRSQSGRRHPQEELRTQAGRRWREAMPSTTPSRELMRKAHT